MMCFTNRLSLFALVASMSLLANPASAATISVTGVTPDGAEGDGEPIVGSVNFGGSLSSSTDTPIPFNDTGVVQAIVAGAQTYAISLNGLDLSSQIAGATDVDVTLDLTLTPNAGGGLMIDGGGTKTWTVDDSVDYDADIDGTTHEAWDEARVQAGETITFLVDNIAFGGSATGALASVAFDAFVGLTTSPVGGSFDTGTGIFTGADGYDFGSVSARANQLSFDLVATAAAVPAPATLPAGLALMTLAMTRRCRR